MKKSFYLLLGLFLIAVSACDDDNVTVIPDPTGKTTGNLTITMKHVWGSSAMSYNQTVSLPSTEKVQFSRLSYLLSDFYLVNEAGTKVALPNQYALIEDHKDNVAFTLTDIPFGTYSSFGFSIGLDSAINHGDPNQYESTHPLSPINNSLHWNWVGGYIFTAIEGKMIPSDETFVFHLAGVQHKLTYELEIQLTSTSTPNRATITYDVNEVFQNPRIYTIAEDGASSHSTTSPVVIKLINNMSNILTGITIEK